MITVACVYVRANVDYSAEYVRRLRSMIGRHLSLRHRFVCLTDRPDELPDVETIEIETPRGYAGWWSKIELFNPSHDLGHRVMSVDLDVLAVSSLNEIPEYDTSFALVPPAGTFAGRGQLKIVRRYNSSVMVWSENYQTRLLYKLWTPSVTRRLWGDQDYIGEVIADADLMPLSWFPRLSEVKSPPWPREAKIVLCKVPKNHEAARQFPWFEKEWR